MEKTGTIQVDTETYIFLNDYTVLVMGWLSL